MADGLVWFTSERAEMIDALDLPTLNKAFLKGRWLDQVAWHRATAARARRLYYALRITTIVGAAVATALASLKLSDRGADVVNWMIFVVSLTTTIAAGLEELLQFGKTWRERDDIAHRLETEGWRYLQRAGPYRGRSHDEAFDEFADRIETILGEPSRGRQSADAPPP